jgi:hypothetical protein
MHWYEKYTVCKRWDTSVQYDKQYYYSTVQYSTITVQYSTITVCQVLIL